MKKEYNSIKFYLDKSVNKSKKDKILRFLKECQDVENYLLSYYWRSFHIIINSQSQIDFNYKCGLSYKYIIPKLKSHHFQQIIQKVYTTLKSIQSNIINNKLKFKFEDKDKQKIYNYCKGFCFEWDYLSKYVQKQLKQYKKKDQKYHEFLQMVSNYLTDEEKYKTLTSDIEAEFWKCKSKYKTPNKNEFQILCNTHHSVKDIQMKEFQWVFIISNNDIVGGTEKKAVFDRLVIPVKFSEYHKSKLEGRKLANTFNLKLNKYGRIEIIACYEVESKENIKTESKNIVGIDIGLKKLITCSDGEIINQNPKIIKATKRITNTQANRSRLEEYLQKKYDNENYKLNDKRYLRKQAKLSNFVKTDNRYKIKQFLNGRQEDLIVMENLKLAYTKTFNKEVNYLLKRMGIQGLFNAILDYAKKLSINTSQVNPAFTSQQCSSCGHVSKENRKTQEMFCCVKCGYEMNADLNASINIMNRHYNKEITLTTPIWRVREILNAV